MKPKRSPDRSRVAPELVPTIESKGRHPSAPTPSSPGDHAADPAATADIEATVATRGRLAPTIRPSSSREVATGVPLLPARYEYRGLLGQGGMGKVLRVYDHELSREVAMKLILPGRASATAEARFLNEARWTARLEHPNIMPVHDAGVLTDGSRYFTMKAVDGESLKARILRHTRGEPFPLGEKLQIMQRLCDAVGYMHDRGVIHRDIKPENILIGAHGEVLLTDLGLVKDLQGDDRTSIADAPVPTLSSRTMDGAVLGTPAYMPPEQARGDADEVGPPADVFSLGAVLYHLLTGSPPYSGVDTLDTLRLARAGCIEPPSRRIRQEGEGGRRGSPYRRVPAEVESIVMKALHRSPIDRYRTAEALGRDLAAYLSTSRVTAHRYSTVERITGAVRRRPTSSLAVALVVIAGLALSTLFSQLSASEQARVAAEARAHWATAERDRAKISRDSAARRADELGTLARGSLTQESRAAVREFMLRLSIAEASGQPDTAILKQLSPQGQRYLRAFDELFRAYELCGSAPSAYEYSLRASLRQYTANDIPGAIADFDQAVQLDPGNATFWCGRGGARIANGDTAGGVRDLDQALKRDARFVPALEERGLYRQAIGDLRGAIDDYTKVLNIEPANLDARTNRGIARAATGDFKAAMDDYQSALSIRPQDCTTLFALGNAHQETGDFKAAIADFSACAQAHPGFSPAYLNRGVCLHKLGRSDEAVADFTTALAIDPQYADALANRATVRREKGDFAGAIVDCDAALRIAPTNFQSLVTRGTARADSGDTDGALADLDQCVSIRPTDANAHYNRGQVLHSIGRYHEAIEDYSAAVAQDPSLAVAFFNRGLARAQLGEIALATTDLEQAISIAPDNAQFRYGRALTLQNSGQLEAAISEYDAALRLDPQHALAQNNRGNALRELGRLDEAKAAYNAALEADPGCSLAYLNRGLLQTAEHKFEEAINNFKSALLIDPALWQAKVGLGDALALWGRTREAIASLQEAWNSCSDTDARERLAEKIRGLGGQTPVGEGGNR